MQSLPCASPLRTLPSLSTITGFIPKNGLVADPGFKSIAPVCGLINIPPVSVCHQVSTIGQLPLPTTLLYHSQASGLIGSPTVPKSFNDFLEVFLTGSFLVCKHGIPLLRKAGGGSIILTASQMGQVAWPGSTAYCTTKGGILQLVKGIALDHKDENIRCNSISPGGVATGRLLARWGDMETAEKEWGPKQALGRLGRPSEIAAGAGTGTDGTTLSFSLTENNYLGKGLIVDASVDASESSLRGGLKVTNTNYNFSGNLLEYGVSSKKTDRPNSGYENTLTQFNIGTRFEQYDDIYLSPNLELSFDDMTVDSTASDTLKKQAGTFNDLSFGYGIQKDTRDRRFMPTSGSIFGFSQKLPIYVEENSSIFNRFSLSKYHSFNENVLGAFKFYAAGIFAVEDDVRLSKRIHIPSRRLRGFESRKIGPVDSGDYVGGNYAMAMNFEAALPNLLPEATQTDVAAFLDIGNLWHADYDSTVGQSSVIRSAIGIATNLYTPIGPLNFVFAQDLSSADSDTTQQFKFQIGTSF